MSRILSNIEKARALLVEAEDALGHPLGALSAAAFAATAAIAMAGVMVLGPGLALDHPREDPSRPPLDFASLIQR